MFNFVFTIGDMGNPLNKPVLTGQLHSQKK